MQQDGVEQNESNCDLYFNEVNSRTQEELQQCITTEEKGQEPLQKEANDFAIEDPRACAKPVPEMGDIDIMIAKYDPASPSSYISAYYYAKGFRHFFSKSKEELQDYIDKLDLTEPGNTILREILSDMLNIQTLDSLHHKLCHFWKIMTYEHLEFSNIHSLKEQTSWTLSRLTSIYDQLGRQDLATNFHTLIQMIQPLNILYMTSLIEKLESAKDAVTNKDIILFLGNCGSGKSASIHFLAGSKMIKTKKNGFFHIEPFDSAPCVRDVKVGVSTQSVTKSMTVVELSNGMIVCDTPGFGDTAGPETDIANGIGLINSLSFTKTIQPVMILSQKNMDKLRGVREMKKSMSSMFVDIPSLLPSMSYFFTKYESIEADMICDQLKTLRDEFTEEEKFDLNYVMIVDDMIKKTNPLAIIIDPLQKSEESPSANKILEDINSIRPLKQSPSEILKIFVSTESEKKLSDHWRVLQQQINLALKAGDIEFLSKPFTEMKILSKLQIETHQPIYEDSVKQLETYALNQYENAKHIFLLFFHRYENQDLFRALQIFKRLLILHPLLLDLLSEYDFATLIHNLILDSLEDLIPIRDDFSDTTDFRLKFLLFVCNEVKKEFFVLDQDQNLQPHPLFHDSSISLNFFDEVRAYYEKACVSFSEEIMKLLQATTQIVQNFGSPNLFLVNVRRLETATKILSAHLPVENMTKEKIEMLSYFLTHSKKTGDQYSSLLYPDQDTDVKSFVPSISKFTSFLSIVQEIPEIDDLIVDGLQIMKGIEVHFLNIASQQFWQIHEACKENIETMHPNYLFVAYYYSQYLQEIIENVPMLIESSTSVVRAITELLNQDRMRRLSQFSRGITKLLNYETLDRELLVVSLGDCLLSLFAAESTFAHLNGFSESKLLIQETIDERLTSLRSSSDRGWENNLHLLRWFISNLRFAEDVPALFCTHPVEFPQLAQLRNESIKEIELTFGSISENIISVSLSQYRNVALVVVTLDQFRLSKPGEQYQALDFVIAQMKEFGETMFASKENSLELAFSFIKSCWNPDGTMTSLPNDYFSDHLSQFLMLVSDFHEFLQQSVALPPGIARDLLFVIPQRLFRKWISAPDSMINLHINEISNYLDHLTSLNKQAQFDSTPVIHQLSLLTKDMFAVDKYIPAAKRNYFSLNAIAVDLLKKCSSDLRVSLQQNLESNNFQGTRESLFQVRSNPLTEINKLLPDLQNLVRDHSRSKLQQLRLHIQQVPRARNQQSHCKKILALGKQLKSFLELLEDFCDIDLVNLLTSSLNQIPVLIEEILTKQVNGIKSSMIVQRYNDCVQQLESFSIMVNTMIAESAYLLIDDLQRYLIQKDEIQQQLHNIMEEEVSKYALWHPQEYPSSPALSLLVSQLQRTQTTYSESLLLNLTKNVLNKLTEILSNVKKNSQSISQCDSELEYVNTTLRYFPQDTTQSIQEFSHVCSTIVEEAKAQIDRHIREEKSFDLLFSKFEMYCNSKDLYSIKAAKITIEKNFLIYCTKLRTDITRKDTLTVMRNQPKEDFNMKRYLKSYKTINFTAIFFSKFSVHEMVQFRDDREVFKGRLEKLREEVFDYLESVLGKIKDCEFPVDGALSFLGPLEKSTSIILEFVGMKRSAEKHNQDFLDLFQKRSSTLATTIFVFCSKLNRYLNTVMATYSDVLRTRELSSIKEFMNKFKEKERFLEVLSQVGQIPEYNTSIFSMPIYSVMVDNLSLELVRWKELLDQQFLGNPATTTVNSQDKDRFYHQIYSRFCAIKELNTLGNHINPKIYGLDQTIASLEAHILLQLQLFEDELNQLLPKFPTTRVELYDQYNLCLENLRSFSTHFEDGRLSVQAKNIFGNAEKSLYSKCCNLRDNALDSSVRDLNELTGTVIQIKSIGVHIFHFSEKIIEILDGLFSHFLNTNLNLIARLGISLTNYEHPIVRRLIQDHKVFGNYQIHARNQQTLKFTIDHLLGTKEEVDPNQELCPWDIEDKIKEFIRGSEIDVQSRLRLRGLYKLYDDQYWDRVEKGYLLQGDEQRKYLSYLVSCATSLSVEVFVDIFDKYIEIGALVFSYWTLDKWYSRDVLKESPLWEDYDREELLQPHAAQIIGIFRLLGIDCHKISHHLAQISTGEGKSVTLAGTAIILALTGTSVDCVCYSEYLIQRDSREFLPLFNAFGVGKLIQYVTFNRLCESVINRTTDLRETVHKLIDPTYLPEKLNGNRQIPFDFGNDRYGESEQKSGDPPAIRSRALLIDEVDVFLNEDFYGNFYHPILKLSHPTISKLIDYVWRNRTTLENLSFKNVRRSPEYLNLMDTFNGWQPLFDELIKALCSDVTKYASHDYIVTNGRIGYKDQDSISYTLSYGFLTMFAYFDLWEKGRITPSVLDKHKFFPIECGTFAFAEIPKLYDHILGVSGTLETLSDKERELLDQVYHISKQTIIPSVYGQNKLTFTRNSLSDIKIESQSGYHIEIANEIRERVRGLSTSCKRAVLVFFESISRLEDFYSFIRNNPLGSEVAIITEATSQLDKEGNIAAAVTSGRVTLLTKAFGRGTDFICYDEELQRNGGIHVLQTFFSFNQSEEIQIKGRTARQGNKGSFSFVLLDADLERIGITDEVIHRMRSDGVFYDTLNEYRARHFSIQYLQDIRHVDEIYADHEKALGFVDNLLNHRDVDSLKEFIIHRNLFFGEEVGSHTTRTIIAMDATGSMGCCIKNAKQSVSKMFQRAYDILQSQGVESSFEMQFVAYRNYNAPPESLLQFSAWASKPQILQKFLESVPPAFGLGHEAIEVALHHVNQQHALAPIGQVVLIGDKPPNSREETISKRQQHRSWAGTDFETPSFIEDEIETLFQNDIRVHSFYVNSNENAVVSAAKGAFEAISGKTGGESTSWDVNAPDASETLTDLVTRHILMLQGGASRGVELVAAYDQQYGRKGHVLNSQT